MDASKVDVENAASVAEHADSETVYGHTHSDLGMAVRMDAFIDKVMNDMVAMVVDADPDPERRSTIADPVERQFAAMASIACRLHERIACRFPSVSRVLIGQMVSFHMCVTGAMTDIFAAMAAQQIPTNEGDGD